MYCYLELNFITCCQQDEEFNNFFISSNDKNTKTQMEKTIDILHEVNSLFTAKQCIKSRILECIDNGKSYTKSTKIKQFRNSNSQENNIFQYKNDNEME